MSIFLLGRGGAAPGATLFLTRAGAGPILLPVSRGAIAAMSTGSQHPSSRIAVVVCSIGRPACLQFLAHRLNRQTRLPDRIVFVVTRPEDAAMGQVPAPAVRPEVVISPKGSAHQRNRGLALVEQDCDLVVFFDDDFVPSAHALADMEEAFAAMPDVNGMTGFLVADGIAGPGIAPADAAARIDRWDAARAGQGRGVPTTVEVNGLYGCNMVYRTRAIRGLRFDENLPLYAWLEDIDFAARVPGRRVRTDAFAGVHCGVKAGRDGAGKRLGYSQVVNPFYLWRKGTVTARFALRMGLRNLLANHVYALRPEPWIDRAARARGNWLGLADIVRGRAAPGRILGF